MSYPTIEELGGSYWDVTLPVYPFSEYRDIVCAMSRNAALLKTKARASKFGIVCGLDPIKCFKTKQTKSVQS